MASPRSIAVHTTAACPPDLLRAGSPPDLMKPGEVATELLMSEKTLANRRSRGEGPPFMRLGRAIRYSRKAVTAWLADQAITPEDAA